MRVALPFIGMALGAAFFVGEICSYLLFLLDLDLVSVFTGMSKNHLNLAIFLLSSWLMLYCEFYRRHEKNRLRLLAIGFIGVTVWYLAHFRYRENVVVLGGYYFYFPFKGFSPILFYLDAALALRVAVGIWNEVVFPKAKRWFAESRLRALNGFLRSEKVWVVTLHTTLATISMFYYLKGPTKITSFRGSDAYQMIWNLWWFKESLWRGTNPFFCDAIFVESKIPVSLVFHSYAPLWGLFSVPFQALMKNPSGVILAYNMAQWLSIVIAGIGSYYLAGLACRHPVPRIIASMIAPYFILTHNGRYVLNYGFTGLIPFQFAFLFLGLSEDHGKFKWAAALTALQAYSGLTYASHMALFTLMGVCYFSIARRKWPVPVKDTAMAIALFLIILAPYLYSLFLSNLNNLASFKVKAEDLCEASVDPLSLLACDSRKVFSNIATFPTVLIGEYYSHFDAAPRIHFPFRQPSYKVFMGFIPLLLASLGIAKRWDRRSRFWMVSATVFLVLSLGPKLVLAGSVVERAVLPYALLQKVPFLSLGRKPVFYMVPFLYCMLFFVVKGADILLESRRLTVAGLLLLTFLDQFKMTPQGTEFEFPAYCQFLAAQKGDFSVIDLPWKRRVKEQEYFMYLQVLHQKKIWGGFVARYFPAKTAQINVNPSLLSGELSDIIDFVKTNPEVRTRFMVVHHPKDSDQTEASAEFGPLVYEDDYAVIRARNDYGFD
ncbi:MAG: hypothetical protein Kow0099_33930 [Candidatus Abyssubacteria bacterium]